MMAFEKQFDNLLPKLFLESLSDSLDILINFLGDEIIVCKINFEIQKKNKDSITQSSSIT